MAEVLAARYWCHSCSQIFPALQGEKCPFCQSDVVEDFSHFTTDYNTILPVQPQSDFGSESALSLLAPLYLGVTINPRRQIRQSSGYVDGNTGGHDYDGVEERNAAETSELDREFESIMRRRRNSATILQMLQGIRSMLWNAWPGSVRQSFDHNC